jgi:membrane protein YqaA with SNARE-associated domain
MNRKRLVFGLLVLLIVAWSITLLIVGPRTIVEAIGIENVYLVAFIIATLGGVSTLTSSSYFLTIVTLGAGGADPYLLGLIAGTGITIGDSLFYYLGLRGREVVNKNVYRWSVKFSEWLDKRPRWLVPFIVFFYAAFTPLPNDILTIALGFSSYPYKYMILPLWAGNIIITIITALLAGAGFDLLM